MSAPTDLPPSGAVSADVPSAAREAAVLDSRDAPESRVAAVPELRDAAEPGPAPASSASAVPGVATGSLRLGLAAASRCRRRVHLDHDPNADRARQRPPDDGLQLRLDTVAQHRGAVRDALAARLEHLGMTLPEGWRPTNTSRPPVVGPVSLRGENRYATIDLLLRMPDGGYAPVLIRGHRTTDPGHGAELTDVAALPDWAADRARRDAERVGEQDGARLPRRIDPKLKLRSHRRDSLALAHALRLLQECGLASTELIGGIIGFGGSSTNAHWDDGAVIAWHRLDPGSGGGDLLADYDERFADRLAVARAAAERGQALAQPSRIAECRQCPWWTVCGPELQAAHDVSLLVAGGDVDILRAAGADTFDDVAVMDEARLLSLPLTGIPPAEARIRARALLTGAPMVRRTAVVDVIRANVEFDVDMESYLDDGAYLWGTYLSGAPVEGFEQGYVPFVTWDDLHSRSAATNFVAFWRYLNRLRAACADRGLTFAAYCYSHKAEERWLYGTPARFPDVDGMPSHDEVAEFCSSPQWVDLYQEVRRLFVVPGSLRLKAIAPIAGFEWRDPEPGGENSMAWYRAATDHQADAQPGTGAAPAGEAHSEKDVISHRQRILDYNEDDVRATFTLRQWMSDFPEAMPTAESLSARVTQRGA